MLACQSRVLLQARAERRGGGRRRGGRGRRAHAPAAAHARRRRRRRPHARHEAGECYPLYANTNTDTIRPFALLHYSVIQTWPPLTMFTRAKLSQCLYLICIHCLLIILAKSVNILILSPHLFLRINTPGEMKWIL